jgi:phospholipid/cholesterol/gamma-HCH transport system permease protein
VADPAVEVRYAEAARGGALQLAGELVLGNAAAALSRARALIPADARSLALDLSALQRLDGGAAALLLDLAERLRQRGVEARFEGARGPVAAILELHAAAARRGGAPQPPSRTALVERVGVATLAALQEVRGALGTLGEVVIATGQVLRRPASLNWAGLPALLQRSGADAAPIVSLITLLVGLVTGYQAAIQLRQLGANIYVADLVALSVTRELGPLMTAIIAAGRSGAAFAAELGTMRVSEEIDALHTLGLDPFRFLVLPRVLSLVVMLPLLTVLANAMGIGGGLIVAVVSLDLTPTGYMIEARAALDFWDVSTGLLKSVFFALAIGLIGCERGLSARGGAEGVGRATTSAVVVTLFALILIDAIFTLIFNAFDV